MNDWYERSMKALQLNGLAKRTQQTYTRAVRQLVDFYGKTPDLISEEELQDYFLHCKCEIRGKLDTRSGFDWTLNPEFTGHPIRF